MSLLVWPYEGGEDGSAEAAFRGWQKCYKDDVVIDDVMGQGKAVKLNDEGDIFVLFDGDTEPTKRVRGHVRVLAQRDPFR